MRWRLLWDAHVEVEVAASPEQVWKVLTDVTRVGEWSHECRSATWLPGHHAPALGAQFAGSNKSGLVSWGRRCTITALEPLRLMVYKTSGGVPPDSTEWRFDLTQTSTGGTRITQSFRILQLARVVEIAIVLLVPQHRDRRPALQQDLDRLGQVAATGVPSAT